MECLEKLVGIASCEESTEPYYIQQIGLSRSQLEELMDDSYPTVDDWFNAMRVIASENLRSDVLGNPSPGIRINSLLENHNVGTIRDNKKTVTSTGWAGIYLDLFNRSDYVKIVINSIKLFVDFTGDIPVKIYNVNTGEEIAETIVSVESGIVASKEISVESRSSIAIVYDTTGIDSYKTTLSTGCTNCGHQDRLTSGFVTASSKSIESPYVVSSLTQKNDTSGLQVDYSVQCDPALWLCSINTELGLAMLYRTAYELLAYSINSGGQFSNQKVTNFEQNKERLTMFEYNYGQQMEKFLKSVKFPTGRCFECYKHIKTVNRLPG